MEDGNKFKHRLWRILEKYGVWQQYKHNYWKQDYRDGLFKEIWQLINEQSGK